MFALNKIKQATGKGMDYETGERVKLIKRDPDSFISLIQITVSEYFWPF